MGYAEASLAERLRLARTRAFVGRTAELAQFRAALAGGPGSHAVLYVHGPGGIGKSALLRRFADEGRAAGRQVVELDGRLIAPSPAGFTAEAAPVYDAGDRPLLLLIDAFEHIQGLEGWLRDRFLPQLPGDAVTVLAGREPPSPAWLSDLAWSQVLGTLELGDLPRAQAAALLEQRGVPAPRQGAVLRFAGGNPLALSLAASVATGRDWQPTPEAIAALATQLVGEVATPEHRLALEVAAHTMATTEGLLRAVVGVRDAGPLFAWLRGLPFADAGRYGLMLHELVRDVVDADFRWRDPDGYERMHRAVGHHLLERARTATGPAALRSVRELTYLKRYGPMGQYFHDMERVGDVHEDALRPGDRECVLRLTEAAEGAESAAVAAFWLRRRPEDFRVYRDSRTGEPVGFMAWLRLAGLRPEEREADPVVAAAWAHTERVAPLRPGEHLLIARLMNYPGEYHGISRIGQLMQARMCTDWIRSARLAWSFIVSARPELWGPLMENIGHRPGGRLSWPNGTAYTLFACDWRVTPLSIWFDRALPGQLAESAETADPGAPALARPLERAAFDRAVREALRGWHRPDLLGGNPLTGARVVTSRPGYAPKSAAPVLRALLAEAVQALGEDPRTAKQHRAVATTYLHRVPSQSAAAERLGLPFSTYRRHLSQGLDRLCEFLWLRETGAG